MEARREENETNQPRQRRGAESDARRVTGSAWRESCLGGEAKAGGAGVVSRREGELRRARGSREPAKSSLRRRRLPESPCGVRTRAHFHANARVNSTNVSESDRQTLVSPFGCSQVLRAKAAQWRAKPGPEGEKRWTVMHRDSNDRVVPAFGAETRRPCHIVPCRIHRPRPGE